MVESEEPVAITVPSAEKETEVTLPYIMMKFMEKTYCGALNNVYAQQEGRRFGPKATRFRAS